MNEKSVTRTHKDRLFRFIFANPEYREWTLSLYNAINGSSYTDADEIRITTIEDVIYLSMKNDLAFLFSDTMNLYEHQSTFNPDMPMRMLIYAVIVYSRYLEENRDTVNLNSGSQQRLPTPRLVCFYNGLSRQPDRRILELRDTFAEGSGADIDARVTMININYGRNKELMERCRPLGEYSLFVESVREFHRETKDMDQAVGKAIDSLPGDSVIKGYLVAHMAEVKSMCITEYDENYEREFLKKESRAKGLAEGRELESRRMDKLVHELLKSNRIEDLKKATTDSEYKNKLYAELKIS